MPIGECLQVFGRNQNIHHVQHADQPGQREEIRVGLCKHPLDFIQLARTLPILCGFFKSMRHTRENLHLCETHCLELDGEREDKPLVWIGWVGSVDFH